MVSTLNPHLWSQTPADNDDADGGINWNEGQAPGSVNSSARGMMAAVAKLIADLNGTKSTTGSLNAYAATGNLDTTALTNGLMITIRANHTNTGASTFNLNTIGAKKIRVFTSHSGEGELSAAMILSGGQYLLEYNTSADSAAGAWILLNPTVDAVPPGTIVAYAASTGANGWLLCDGQAVSRTTYAALFAVIGIAYGAGNGVSTFNVPDLTGRTIFGKESSATRITAASSITSTALGNSGGVDVVTLSTSQIPSHTHTFSATTGGESVAHTHSVVGTTSTESADHTHNGSGTTSTESLSHTHAGTTGSQSDDHTHGVSGTSGTQSADHTHSGTTATESAGHTHSGTTGTDSPDHVHSYTVFNALVTASAGGQANIWQGSTSTNTGGVSATHTHSFTTGGVSATHTHTFTTGGVSASHTHSFSATTGGVSVGHTHSFTTGDQSANHTHTYSFTTSGKSATHTHSFSVASGNESVGHTHDVSGTSGATGGGTSHSNMPPMIIMNWIIKS